MTISTIVPTIVDVSDPSCLYDRRPGVYVVRVTQVCRDVSGASQVRGDGSDTQ